VPSTTLYATVNCASRSPRVVSRAVSAGDKPVAGGVLIGDRPPPRRASRTSGTVARVTGHRQQPLGGGQHGQQLGRAVSENTDASPCGLERTSPQSRRQAKWAETVDCRPRCAVRSTTQTMSWESGAPRPEPERPLFTYDEREN
jgi:hypothetical protein